MISRARAKLQEIQKYPYFQSVGKPLAGVEMSVGSWTAAAELCRSYKWETCQLMARNRLQQLVEEKSWDRSETWNVITEDLRPDVLLLVNNITAPLPISSELIKNIVESFSWDLLFICLEQEYRDIVQASFYLPVLDPVYRAGHFPCGWEGDEFPARWNGNLKGGHLLIF